MTGIPQFLPWQVLFGLALLMAGTFGRRRLAAEPATA